jgi:hypothetical protein
MSYIIKCVDPFVSLKLTDVGRMQLAKGQLNFSFWAAGDSEINYDREAIVEANPLVIALSVTSEILRPKDRQPELKSYLVNSSNSYFNDITPAVIKTVKVIVNNAATERGFFSGTTANIQTLTGSSYVVDTGIISTDKLTGGTTLALSAASLTIGDILLLKLTTQTKGALTLNTNNEATPHLFYKIQSTASTTEIVVDRALPNLSAATAVDIQYIIYPQGEVKDAFGMPSQTYYWDTGTLAFDSSCDVSIEDVPVWNMNNIYAETPAGITGTSSTYEGYQRFGSYTYLGQMNPYFGFDLEGTGISSTAVTSVCQGLSGLDNGQKVLSVLHYTNYTISNFYGEFFHIDIANDKRLTVTIPDIMYHRRDNNSGTGNSGLTMGMEFTTSGSSQYVGTSNIEYYDLIESPTYVTGRTTISVGRVYPQLKIITIHDEELASAMSYKSNRNWTLPSLALNLQSSSTGTGILEQNKVMYVTYQLANTGTTGFTTSLPCQKYAKILNSTNASKDIQFRIEDINLLPYMRKVEDAGYDGRGFYANAFNLVYQIVDDNNTRPDPDAWSAINYTTTAITETLNATINPTSYTGGAFALDNQNPTANGFILSNTVASGGTLFSMISDLSLAPQSNPEYLQFGDERFFYGNINTQIGATIYKTIFKITLDYNYFSDTTNSTRSTDINTNPPNLRVSELAIYDSNKNLVMIGKLSQPVALVAGQTIMIEASMDF